MRNKDKLIFKKRTNKDTVSAEANGNPLQCSWLENPGDGGTWRAAVYGVAQSHTWLKRLSISKKKKKTNKKNSLPNGKWSEVKTLSRVRLVVTPWTAACQAPPSMGFSRQKYWSGLPFPSPGYLPHPGIELESLDCRQTLYHLNHQGSPPKWKPNRKPWRSTSICWYLTLLSKLKTAVRFQFMV